MNLQDFKNIKNMKYFHVFIGAIISILIVLIGFLLTHLYLDNKAKDQALNINPLLSVSSFSNCENILLGDLNSIQKNKYIDSQIFGEFTKTCTDRYSLANMEITENNCRNVISSLTSEDLKNTYVFVDTYEKIKSDCGLAFQKVHFTTPSFFDVENDFKSELHLEFSVPFFNDLSDSESDEFLQNRIQAKKNLLDTLHINPNVDIQIDDVVLYSKSATLYMKLEPQTEYSVTIQNAKIKGETEDENELTSFDFTTPENKYLGIKILDPVSLYMDTRTPKFQILDYDSGKNTVSVTLCKIDEEDYHKIDLLKSRPLTQENKDFFVQGIDSFQNVICEKKEIVIRKEGETQAFVKKDFDFEQVIGSDTFKDGLYYVTFDNYIDREFNQRVQSPILFGIIGSHITMKLSKNGEAFFFVNDFEGTPLSGQEISFYLNDFKGKNTSWNEKKSDYDRSYNSPLDTRILSEPILIGKTKENGILQVNLKDKIPEFFERTFDDNWGYDWNGNYNSFFIKSSGDDVLSYNSSKWNAGIAPWNFGYKTTGYSNGGDDITLNRWGGLEPDYYTHIYTDRVLYLPNEMVYLKAIVRKSADLSVEVNKSFQVKVIDSNGKNIFSKDLKLNEFGSLSDSLLLSKDSPLGYYTALINDGDNQIGATTFSVEVFKNPKFKTDINVQAYGLEAGVVKIDKVKEVNYWTEEYTGKFSIKANLSSKYYNGSSLGGANYSYKIYKQPYYENAWWESCFYGCYWEPQKEFYTSGEGVLDAEGVATVHANIDFTSNYDDYKYIFEVTVKDATGDAISSSNSIVVKLPDAYKKWNSNFELSLSTQNKFYKAGEKFTFTGGLEGGKWTQYFDDKYVLIIKKKNYITKNVDDVRGYSRTVNSVEEELEDIMFINSKNFKVDNDGKIEGAYSFKDSGEYVFEYGKIDDYLKLADNESIEDVIKEFQRTKNLTVNVDRKYISDIFEVTGEEIKDPCAGKTLCHYEIKNYEEHGDYNTGRIFQVTEIKNEDLSINSLLNYSKKYFSLLSYSDKDAANPIINDNKLQVFSEKVSYKIGETAKVLIRLPFSKGKVLWTVEKQGVVKSEYIDVNSNIFFKEVVVDDTFVPNAYIGVLAIEVDGNKVPEYKVGYTEIVVDKNDKKSFIDIQSDKKVYAPRDEVILNFDVKDIHGKPNRSELTVMVVDDSLISLMGNIDLNTLEKFYKKLEFQIQTSLTNLSMLKNYYFSRPGIVGGSGAGNFKGGDSAVSTRNIFKNTAYYNPSVITDTHGKAQVKFNLPDNLTNFRIIVLSNSKDNLFGASEEFIEVRKSVIVEPKMPQILREGDEIQIGANIFNNTNTNIGFQVELKADNVEIETPEKNIEVEANKSRFVSFKVKNRSNDGIIHYSISAVGDTLKNTDIYEGTIDIKQSPVLIQTSIENGTVAEKSVLDLKMNIPANVDLEKSKVEVSFSNNILLGIEKIVTSLAHYPYGCIEQTTSSTLPNVILKQFGNIFKSLDIKKADIDKNINDGVARIQSMQMADGGFTYWPGGSSSDSHISPYVVRSLIDMKNAGTYLPDGLLEKGMTYIEKQLMSSTDDLEKAEIFWTLAKAGKTKNIDINLKSPSRHTLLVYTYGLVLQDRSNPVIKTNIERIKLLLDADEDGYRYWNKLSDKAIFASMLMDYEYDKDYINLLTLDIYNRDWDSYYYSTQEKNNAFMAFVKYINKYGADNKNSFGFELGKIGNAKKSLYLGQSNPNIIKKEYSAKEVFNSDDTSIGLQITNISGADIFSSLILKNYPKDVEKIAEFSHGIDVKKQIYEVSDTSKLDICEQAKNDYYNRGKDISNLAECDGIYTLHTSKDFGKGKTYKAQITIKFKDSHARRNLVLEDYLPTSFRVLNNNFQTESIGTAQNTTQSWSWDHVEFKPDVVFATASVAYGDTLDFEYFFIPEFEGRFVNPPVTAYMMYNPETRANSKFEIIQVK